MGLQVLYMHSLKRLKNPELANGLIDERSGFLGGSDGKESTCNTGDLGLIPGLGRSPGGGHSHHSSILAWRIPMDRGTWQAIVHEVAKSQTQLSD